MAWLTRDIVFRILCPMADEVVSRAVLSSQVYEIIRSRITSLELQPGAPINVGALSDELGVSPIPIREAVKGLTERGLVRERPRRGYEVVRLSDQRVREIFDVRTLLETTALRCAIRTTPHDLLERVHSMCMNLGQASMGGTELRAALDESDRLLHQECIMRYSDNQFMIDLYLQMNDFLVIVRHLNDRIAEAIAEHSQLLDAFLRRDLVGTRRLLVQHLENAKAASLPVPQEPTQWTTRRPSLVATVKSSPHPDV